MLFFLDTQAEDVTFDVSKCNDVFLLVCSDGGDLILVIVEMVLVVNHTAHVPESFDGAVPGSSGYSLSFGHVDEIDDRVIVGGERFRLAAIHNVKKINVVIPGADLNDTRFTAKV